MRSPVVGVGVGVTLAALLAGCATGYASPTASPTRYAVPGIVGDVVSDDALESDEWVVAARAGLLGYVLASNAADFSIEPYLGSLTADGADLWFRQWSSRSIGEDRTPLTWPGPMVLLPRSIEPLDAVPDRVEVLFCDGSDYWIDEDPARLRDGRVLTVELVRSGGRILLETTTSSGEACDATGAPIAVFDPPPAPHGTLTESDVVPPPR